MAKTEKRRSAPNDTESWVYKKPPQYYFVWQKGEGIPIHEAFYIEDLANFEEYATELARKGVEIRQQRP